MIRSEAYIGDIKKAGALDQPWKLLEDKVVMITGAAGLIGTVIVDILMERNRIYDNRITILAVSRNEKRILDRFHDYLHEPHFAYLCHNVNLEWKEEGRADYIIHAASNTHPVAYSQDPVGTIETNVTGSKHLLDYAVRHHTNRFVFLSSVEIYGENRGDVELFDEEYCGYIDCNTLRAGYPESKRLGEALCNAYNKAFQLDIVIPRISRVYGPTVLENDSKALSQFIKNAVDGKDIVLKSEGTQKYSYCYCVDAAYAVLMIMLKGKCKEAYNVADNSSNMEMREYASLIASYANRKVIYQLPEKQEVSGFSKVQTALMDSSKLLRLGWKADTSVDKGLRKTIEMLKMNYK